ncbi:unnamed protein product [Phytophthora lilii]|uniref:Unnamed protein product n=1 Tax=Phytophthora lilii TaxID=2077276 RepID=A0A9W6TVJ0_9STRA|nr:unnamed protein product [Phytophthora lilii]
MSRRPDFMHEENMNLAAISNQQDIQQRIDWDITSLMKEAVSRYKEDAFTASLMIELSKANKDNRDKQVIRNLQRYSLVKGKIFIRLQVTIDHD